MQGHRTLMCDRRVVVKLKTGSSEGLKDRADTLAVLPVRVRVMTQFYTTTLRVLLCSDSPRTSNRHWQKNKNKK